MTDERNAMRVEAADRRRRGEPDPEEQTAQDILREVVLELDRSIALYGLCGMTQDLLDLHGKASRFLCLP